MLKTIRLLYITLFLLVAFQQYSFGQIINERKLTGTPSYLYSKAQIMNIFMSVLKEIQTNMDTMLPLQRKISKAILNGRELLNGISIAQ